MSADPSSIDAGLVLHPFRATRYGPAAGEDLGAVASPPYDVIDEESVGRLFSSHPYNVVRLIVPRRFSHAASYQAVNEVLASWREQGVLVEDVEPALYVYEYTVADRTVRGLVGSLGLRDRHSGVVLPHEDVMPGLVSDRAELIARTSTNLEPILLVYDGDGAASDLADAATERPPFIQAIALDGSKHSVWRIGDADVLREIAVDLAPRRALIADGHHRYAAYQQVQRSAPGGEHDFGLAMLVDQRRYPLHLGPIHRVLSGLALDEIVDMVDRDSHSGNRVRCFGADRAAATAAVLDQAPVDAAAFVCSDGGRWLVVWSPRHQGEIDTHVLHDRLLPAWNLSDDRVGYVHDADHAVSEARNHAGVAVLVRPPSVADVVAAAEQGRTLPRKSTSFGPKPQMGLLMRTMHP